MGSWPLWEARKGHAWLFVETRTLLLELGVFTECVEEKVRGREGERATCVLYIGEIGS